MERHANKTNVIETIKVPLQKTTKSGRTIFAYMRRSTTKKEQASSLPQQEEMIEYIANELGIDLENIKPYIESKSGYENRKRPEWNKMLGVIDSLKEPCIILCRDTSRLSRNPKDNLAIADRMFRDNDFKKIGQKIGNIYFLDGMKVVEWNEKTEKKYVADTLHQNYTDSIENKSKCIGGVLSKLNMGEFPYCPPHGLSRVNKDGLKRMSRSEKTTLMQDGEMPFIYHAFEMKAKGKTAKEICQYLKQYGNIHISGKVLVETLFANTVYKGVYTEKTTGTLFDKIKFWEGKPPIDPTLWERANANINKRGYGFGEGQSEHIAPGILRHESGKSLYLYKAKGKYNAYQTEIKSENGKRKSIGIMESKLVKEFLNITIPKLTEIYKNIFVKDLQGELDIFLKKSLPEQEEINMRFISNKKYILEYDPILFIDLKLNFLSYEEFLKEQIINRKSQYGGLTKDVVDDFSQLLARMKNTFKDNKDYLYFFEISTLHWESYMKDLNETNKIVKDRLLPIQKIEEKERQEQSRNELVQKKKELETKKTNIEDEAWNRGFDMNFVNRKKGQIDIEIQSIQEQIDLLSESNNIEAYLDRLPEILLDLHELSSKVLSDADYDGMRNDIKQLIEIVSHELTLTNKKELKIKLFEGLENLETGKMWNGATDWARTSDLLLRREAF